jgi:hypothetical protein
MKICKNVPIIVEISDEYHGLCGKECVFMLGGYCSFFNKRLEKTEDDRYYRRAECMVTFDVESER